MEHLFLICFAVGLILSVLSLVSGFGHLHLGHLHLGHAHHTFAVRGPHAPHHGCASAINGFTVMAWLMWFGGAGMLLARHTTLSTPALLLLASIAGLAGAALIWALLFRVLMPRESELSTADTAMIGVVGRLTNSIRADGGIGEILFSQAGSRKASAARSTNGNAIARDTEVVVEHYDRGIAWVRPTDA